MSTIEKKSIPSKFLLSPVKIYFLTMGPNNFGNKILFLFISGNGAQFQIRVLTTAANTGAAGSGFDLVYAQVGCS